MSRIGRNIEAAIQQRSPSPCLSSHLDDVMFSQPSPSLSSVSSISLPEGFESLSPGFLDDIDDILQNGFEHEVFDSFLNDSSNTATSPPNSSLQSQLRILSPLHTPIELDLLAPIENFDYEIPDPQHEIELPNNTEYEASSSSASSDHSLSGHTDSSQTSSYSSYSSVNSDDGMPSHYAYGRALRECPVYTFTSFSVKSGDENLCLEDLRQRIKHIPARGVLIPIFSVRYGFKDSEGLFNSMFTYRTNSALFQALGKHAFSFGEACRVSLSLLYRVIRDRPEVVLDIATCQSNANRIREDAFFLPIRETFADSDSENVEAESPDARYQSAFPFLEDHFEKLRAESSQCVCHHESIEQQERKPDSSTQLVYTELLPARFSTSLSIAPTTERNDVTSSVARSNSLNLLADAALYESWHCAPQPPRATLVSLDEVESAKQQFA